MSQAIGKLESSGVSEALNLAGEQPVKLGSEASGLVRTCAPQGQHLRRFFTLRTAIRSSICGRYSVFMGRVTHRVGAEGLSRLLSNDILFPRDVPLSPKHLSLGKGYLGTTDDSLQLLFHMCYQL